MAARTGTLNHGRPDPLTLPLPDRFLDALGHPRVIETFDSPAMRARLAELLRRQGLAEPQAMPTGPRRYVALHWEPAGDELAFTDGVHSGAGQLQQWIWLDYLHGRAPGCAAAGARVLGTSTRKPPFSGATPASECVFGA